MLPIPRPMSFVPDEHLPPLAGGRPASYRQATVDAVCIVCLVGGFFLLSSELELSERFAHWANRYERFQVDELPLTLLVLAVCLVVYAYRRVAELSAQVQARHAAQTLAAQALADNRRLAQQLIMLQEQERQRLAHELHDEVGQFCVAIQVDAATIAADTRTVLPDAHASARAIERTAEELHRTIRGMLERLRPVALDTLGLPAALQTLTSRWGSTHRTPCQLVTSGPLDQLGEAFNITLYRIVQEALTNVARHARASHVVIQLHAAAPQAGQPAVVTLDIEDNGCGMSEPLPTRKGMGLAGMRERTHALRGTLVIEPARPQGTRLLVTLPLAKAPCQTGEVSA